jgi:hypothetical protein
MPPTSPTILLAHCQPVSRAMVHTPLIRFRYALQKVASASASGAFRAAPPTSSPSHGRSTSPAKPGRLERNADSKSDSLRADAAVAASTDFPGVSSARASYGGATTPPEPRCLEQGQATPAKLGRLGRESVRVTYKDAPPRMPIPEDEMESIMVCS